MLALIHQYFTFAHSLESGIHRPPLLINFHSGQLYSFIPFIFVLGGMLVFPEWKIIVNPPPFSPDPCFSWLKIIVPLPLC